MKIKGLRRSREMVGGIVFFGRMIDKIRLSHKGELPEDYNLGTGYDARLCEFLNIRYDVFRDIVLAHEGSDQDLLSWCFQNGRQPTSQDIEFWNSFILKQGWRDDTTANLEQTKVENGMSHQVNIQTWVDFHDADEGYLTVE